MNAGNRFIASAALAALAALSVSPTAQAAFTDGSTPYTDLTGTGTTSDSYGSPAAAGWHNNSVDGGDSVYWEYPAHGNAPLYYQETWGSTLKTIGTVIIDTSTRPFSGTVYAQTSPGGPYSTVVGSFGPNSKRGVTVVNPTTTSMYGIKIEINSSTDSSWYQAGEVSLYKETFDNVARGQTSVFTVNGSPSGGGSLTDESWGTEWRSSTGDGTYTAGFEFTDGLAHPVQALRYAGGVPHAANYYVWRNPTVQIKQGGIWSDLGTVNFSNTSESLRWIDFGAQLQVQGVRFSGVNPGINNGGDVFIDDIMALAMPPSPPPSGTLVTIR